jgi:hypothetical protein
MHLPLASRPWDLLKSHLKTNFNTNRLLFAVFEQFTFNKSDGRPFGRPPLPTSRSHYPARHGQATRWVPKSVQSVPRRTPLKETLVLPNCYERSVRASRTFATLTGTVHIGIPSGYLTVC